MNTGPIARVAAVLAVGFGAGLAGGHAVERMGAAPALATASVAVPFATAMPPTETHVLTVHELAGVALADRENRPFTLADTAGAVTVVGLETEPCGSACAVRVAQSLEVRRRVSAGRAKGDGAVGGTGGGAATVEFVLVSSASEALPAAAIAAGTATSAPDLDGTRWRTGRAGARDLAELGERLGVARSADASRAARPTVHLFDASGALVQRYRADPLDIARLVDEVGYLSDRGG